MKWLGAAGGVLMVVSPFLAWIQAPIGGEVASAVRWVAIAIGSVGVVAGLYRWRSALALCGVAGLSLCLFSVLGLGSTDAVFWSLLDENAQYAQMVNFSGRFFPGNFGVEPGFEPRLGAETVSERFGAALYFMGRGWWSCLAGSVSVLGAALGAGAWRRREAAVVAVGAALIFAAPGTLLVKGLIGQYLEEQGDRRLASARYEEAIEKYGAAERFDPQLARSEGIHLKVGEAYYHLSQRSDPHARFYLGDLYYQRGDRQAGIAEFRLAADEASGPLKEIVHRRLGWAYAAAGVDQYRKALPGPAASSWERALESAPDQTQAGYFLARSYFDQGRYEESLSVSRFLLSRSERPLLNADVDAIVGDAYWKLGDVGKARSAYEDSMQLDLYGNFRAFKSLGGT